MGAATFAIVAVMAAAALLPPAAHAQEAPGNATAGAGPAPEGAPGAWVAIGIALAIAAVAGTIWNGLQLYRHVNLMKRDMDGRLRPDLGWTTDLNSMLQPRDVDGDSVFRIRIINAGQVAATGIVCSMRLGLASDFEAGRIRRERECRGSLAPNMVIEVRVPITYEQMRAASQQDRFRAEIVIEYRGPGVEVHYYKMSGDYDGVWARWRG